MSIRRLYGPLFRFGPLMYHVLARPIAILEKLSPAWRDPCLVGPSPAQKAKIGTARPGLAWPGPACLQRTLKYYFTSGCSPGRKWGNTRNWNSSEEFKHNVHTCTLQISEQLEKALSFNMDVITLLLEDAWCIPFLEKVDDATRLLPRITIPLPLGFPVRRIEWCNRHFCHVTTDEKWTCITKCTH